MRRGWHVVSILFFWLALAGAAHAEKRVALVIGNASYESAPKLGNPASDAAAMGAAFERLGFTVTEQTDLGFDAMRRALREFAGTAAGADLAVIYYAGHGMEIGGENYLVPTDARLASDVDVPYEAISVNLALGALEGARGMRLLILDACRNNPFLAKMKVGTKTRSISRGLARVEPDVGTIVAYAAKEGTVAEDGDAEHSPFTRAILEHIEEPGIDVQFLFRKVRDSVLEETNGKQEPFTYGSLPGRAVILSPAKEVPPPPPPAVSGSDNEIAAEVAFWNTVKDSNDRGLLESYLNQYPNGRFASLAKIFIARIDADAAKAAAKQPEAPPPAAPSPPAGPDVAAAGPVGAKPLQTPSARDKLVVADNGPPAEAGEIAIGAGAAPAVPPPVPDKVGGSGLPPAGDQGIPPGVDAAGAAPVGPVASLTPPGEPAEAVQPAPDLIRNIQKELTRVGCSAGAADGRWGKKGRSAVEAFVRYSKISLASLDPSPDMLSTLQGYGGRACPLTCSARYEAKGDSCVLKSCPSGQTLTSRGDCYAPPPPKVKQAAPAVGRKGSTASASGGGGGCQRETAAQCVGRLTSARDLSLHPNSVSDFEIEARCSAAANRTCR